MATKFNNRKCNRHDSKSTLTAFTGLVIEQMQKLGKVRIAETYEASVKSFMRFRQDSGEAGDIALQEICGDTMKGYEHWLREKCGVCRNTISFYMRNLRAVYNRAVELGITCDLSPFRHVYTGVDKTSKRAVTPETLRAITALELNGQPELQRARDYFLLIFQLRGISFVDLARLETSWLHGGYLRYCRQKTGQTLEIRWEDSMQEIVERYHSPGSRYLLPILSDGESINSPTGRRHYQSALRQLNAGLNCIGSIVGSPNRLTTYTARHAWASAAHRMNVPIAVISQALGHDSEKTTRIYLDSLDNKQVDDANRMLIKAVTGRE